MSETPEIKLWIKRARMSEKGVSYETFRLLGWIDGKRIRKQFKSRDEAEGEKSRLEIEAANKESGTRTLNTRFTAAQLADAEAAFGALAGQATLSGAVQWYLANFKPPVTDVTLPIAKIAFIADRKPHVRPPTLRDYEGTLDAFIASFPAELRAG